jgi:hypothetical protein
MLLLILARQQYRSSLNNNLYSLSEMMLFSHGQAKDLLSLGIPHIPPGMEVTASITISHPQRH